MPRVGYPSDKQDQYMVRFPDGMRERLKSEAESNKRSMNAEIIARLEHSLSGVSFSLPPDLRERIADAAKRNHRQLPDELWNALYAAYPTISEAAASSGPGIEEVSEFEREFVEAHHKLLLRLMRKHGMEPLDARELAEIENVRAPTAERKK